MKKVALVLGGGGSRGLAHIGVLKVLQQENIPIDMIVATSMGGIVGVLHGLNYQPDEMSHNIAAIQEQLTFNLKLISSTARQDVVRQQLKPWIREQTFADLSLPVTLMTVDMEAGVEIQLNEGPLLPAMLASSAVPGAFPPVPIGKRKLSDGGVIDSLATHAAFSQGATHVIAVDVHPPLDEEDTWNDPLSAVMGFQMPFGLFGTGLNRGPNMVSALWRSTRVMTWYLHEARLLAHPPDVLLRPNISQYGSLDFKDVAGPITAGVEAAEAALDNLLAIKDAPSDPQNGRPSESPPSEVPQLVEPVSVKLPSANE